MATGLKATVLVGRCRDQSFVSFFFQKGPDQDWDQYSLSHFAWPRSVLGSKQWKRLDGFCLASELLDSFLEATGLSNGATHRELLTFSFAFEVASQKLLEVCFVGFYWAPTH